MKLIDKTDEVTTKMDRFIEKVLPYVIWFTAGYFTGILVAWLQ